MGGGGGGHYQETPGHREFQPTNSRFSAACHGHYPLFVLTSYHIKIWCNLHPLQNTPFFSTSPFAKFPVLPWLSMLSSLRKVEHSTLKSISRRCLRKTIHKGTTYVTEISMNA